MHLPLITQTLSESLRPFLLSPSQNFINLPPMDALFFDQSPYSEYMDDLNNSEGFYVTPSRDGSVLLGAIRRVREYNSYPKAENAAKFAVEKHNMKEGEKGSLKFLGIVNLNVEPAAGAVYYITMAAADDSGEISHYQAKVWEKINTGYQVQIFRLAPYWIKSSDKLAKNYCCVGVANVTPWMDESYFYYKCFYRARKELLGAEIIRNKKSGPPKCVLWFASCAASERILKDYVGKRMPCTTNYYHFDLSTCPRNFII